MDHDQRFKTLIREFFADFLRLFFADTARRLRLDRVEWLDKEAFPDPPEGSRHVLDMIARVPVAEEHVEPGLAILLIHVEIESPDRTTSIKPRLSYYYHFLRDKYQLPVLPIVIYLKVGLDGIGEDTYTEAVFGFEVVRFQYLYVGLPGLDAVEYVQGDTWLGVALSALMRIPKERIVWLGTEALKKLAKAPLSEQHRYLLGECVEAYLPLDDREQQEFEKALETEQDPEVRKMGKSLLDRWLERGIEQGKREGLEEGLQQGIQQGIQRGLEQGIVKGEAELLLRLLRRKFGELDEATIARVEKADAEQLLKWGEHVLTAKKLEDVFAES